MHYPPFPKGGLGGFLKGTRSERGGLKAGSEVVARPHCDKQTKLLYRQIKQW
jgi:hypothetical protein